MQVALVPVSEDDHPRVVQTLVSAFVGDPVERWLYAAPDEYLLHFPEFVSTFGGPAFYAHTVWELEGCAAVAMWMPPGVEPDGDAIIGVLRRTVPPAKHQDAFAVLEQMDLAHPRSPHWYLPWLGVEPREQGQGLGSQLLARCLEIVDTSGLPAYLETPNPRTVSMYRRHGFQPTVIAQAGDCPPVTCMLREGR